MHIEESKMQEEPTNNQDPYSLTPLTHPINGDKAKMLEGIVKKYIAMQKKFQSQPFFSRQQYYILSKRWLDRWKIYVAYAQFTQAIPPNKFFGCGILPVANEDIIQTKNYGSFEFDDSLDHLNIQLKDGLQENLDFVYVSKEMYYALKDCEDYQMTRVVRYVVDTKQGKKVQLYYFKMTFLILHHSQLKLIERNGVLKFKQIKFQYSHYALVSEFRSQIFNYMKKPFLQVKEFTLSNEIKFWLLPPTADRLILFKNIKEGCQCNNSYDYRIYLQGQVFSEEKQLSDYDIIDSSILIAEILEQEKSFSFFNNKYPYEGPCNECRIKNILKVLCSCKYAAYCSTACKSKDKHAHQSRCPKKAESDGEEEPLQLTESSNKGLTGLRNLGNTCFMNSGIQCISHIKQFVKYFTQDHYLKQINMENPMGTHGELSRAYAKLLQSMWFGSQGVATPNALKKAIGKFQQMFSGYNQHDSSELINYLLDGLNEDLNRIKKKPYVQTKDSNGRSDKIVAAQTWQGFMMRNQSIIVDLCYGQYKSVLNCPQCKNESVQFDPFLMCSMPLVNNNRKKMEIVFLRDHFQQIKVKISYHVSQKPTVQLAEKVVRQKMEIHPQSKLLFFLSSYTGCRIIKTSDSLDELRKDSYKTLFVRELLKGEDPENDLKIQITHKITVSDYSLDGYKKEIVPIRPYYFSPNLTYKQVHFRIYSYFKKYYEVAEYEKQVVNAELKDQPFKFICQPAANYADPCVYCGNKHCRGCWLRFSDEKFMSGVKILQNRIEIDIIWRKLGNEIQKRVRNLRQDKSGKSQEKNGITIQDCFEHFQQPQVLQENNEWYCPKCKNHVRASKQMQIYRSPKILILALKRFRKKSSYSEKNSIFVNYPIEGLDLSKFVLDPELPNTGSDSDNKKDKMDLTYDLIGVSNHMGSTGGGHYTAYCKDLTSQDWYEFDDSYVTRLTNKQQVVSSSGYVLFYRRRD